MAEEPPIQIHSPRLHSIRVVPLRHGGTSIEMQVASGAASEGPRKITLVNPILLTGAPRPAIEAEIRRCFSADCVLLSFFVERHRLEFWGQDALLCAVKGGAASEIGSASEG